MDKRSFSSIDSYSDVYFGNLGHLLEMNNKDFFYIFNILTPTEVPHILKNLSKVKIPWKLFEDFLEFSDIIRAFYMARRRKKEEKIDTFFSGREVSDLLNAGYIEDRYSVRTELSCLSYFAARNMTRQFSVKSFVYPFENHIWEKMVLIGLREDSPQTNIVGYAHSTVNLMYLPYSVSVNEKKLLPLPDIILVNGQRAKKTLVESGFDENKITVIGAMRYGLFTSDEFPKLENNKTVLVILSADINTSLEMIQKSVQAFGKMDSVRILIKPHPAVYSRIFQQYIKKFPSFFAITSASLADLKRTINLAVYSNSTAAVEVATQKIPLIHMKSDFTIDVNVFEFTDKVPSISSPEMIQKMAFDILFNGLNKNQSLNDEINELFAKVNEIEILSKI
jgi:surface carbohydrate biosynthesis protein (TIGR04326 family)